MRLANTSHVMAGGEAAATGPALSSLPLWLADPDWLGFNARDAGELELPASSPDR